MKRVIFFIFLLTSSVLYSQDPTIRTERDEFQGITWMNPYQYWPTYSGFYLYFGKDDSNNPVPLRIKIHYFGNNWIFFEQMTVLANGKTFKFALDRFNKKTKVNRGVYEVYDYAVSELPFCLDMLAELDSAKTVQVRFSGDFRHDFALTYGQISIIKKYFKEYVRLFGMPPQPLAKPLNVNINTAAPADGSLMLSFIFVGVAAIIAGFGYTKWKKHKQEKQLKYMEEMRAIRLAKETEEDKPQK